MIKAVFFDLDGTLCDTLPDLTVSVNYALRTFDLPVYQAEEVRHMVGKGAGSLCALAVPYDRQDLLPQVIALFRAHYTKYCTEKTVPFDGMADVLEELFGKGILLGVLSNKPQIMTERVISGCFRDGLFSLVSGQTERLPLKPDASLFREALERFSLSPSEALYVGDSDTDLQFAINASVPFIGCAWGYRGKQFLLEHGAKNVIDSPKELLGFLSGQEG